MESPDISVIIPHYNDLERLETCLQALGRQSFPADRFEIIISDNGSTAGEAAVAAVIAGRARLVVASERGAGPARNAGVLAARGALLAFTDSDCIPDPDWLAAGFAAREKGDLIGGRMDVSVEPGRRMSGAEAFERVFAFDNRGYIEKKGFTVTANLFCTRAVFEAVGPFRAAIAEDVEWCHRAIAMGYRLVYAEEVPVTHPARRDWAELKRKWQRINLETMTIAKTRPLGQLVWFGRTLLMPASIVVHAPKVFSSRALPDGRARLSALAMLTRLRLWRAIDSFGLMLGGGR